MTTNRMHLNFNPFETGAVVPFLFAFVAMMFQSIALLPNPVLESITPVLAFLSALLGVLFSAYKWYQAFTERKHDLLGMKSMQATHSEDIEIVQRRLEHLEKENSELRSRLSNPDKLDI